MQLKKVRSSKVLFRVTAYTVVSERDGRRQRRSLIDGKGAHYGGYCKAKTPEVRDPQSVHQGILTSALPVNQGVVTEIE
jgi:hypothetical protein